MSSGALRALQFVFRRTMICAGVGGFISLVCCNTLTADSTDGHSPTLSIQRVSFSFLRGDVGLSLYMVVVSPIENGYQFEYGICSFTDHVACQSGMQSHPREEIRALWDQLESIDWNSLPGRLEMSPVEDTSAHQAWWRIEQAHSVGKLTITKEGVVEAWTPELAKRQRLSVPLRAFYQVLDTIFQRISSRQQTMHSPTDEGLLWQLLKESYQLGPTEIRAACARALACYGLLDVDEIRQHPLLEVRSWALWGLEEKERRKPRTGYQGDRLK